MYSSQRQFFIHTSIIWCFILFHIVLFHKRIQITFSTASSSEFMLYRYLFTFIYIAYLHKDGMLFIVMKYLKAFSFIIWVHCKVPLFQHSITLKNIRHKKPTHRLTLIYIITSRVEYTTSLIEQIQILKLRKYTYHFLYSRV